MHNQQEVHNTSDACQAATVVTEASHSNRLNLPWFSDQWISDQCNPIPTSQISPNDRASLSFCLTCLSFVSAALLIFALSQIYCWAC